MEQIILQPKNKLYRKPLYLSQDLPKSRGVSYLKWALSLLIILFVGVFQGVKADEEQKPEYLHEILHQEFLLEQYSHTQVEPYIERFRAESISIFSHLDKERLIIFNYILSQLEARDMPLELVFIPLIESSYLPNASNAGTHIGLWQMGKPTARAFGVPIQGGYDGRYNIEEATAAALDYLEYLNHFFKGDWLLTVAAYNAGEGRVQRAMRYNRSLGRSTDYWSLTLPNVTKQYIPKMLALAHLATHDRHFRVKRNEIPKLARVEVSEPEQLTEVVKRLSINDQTLEFYNPHYSYSHAQTVKLIVPRY